MIFLPIVGRELRVAARRRATHWVRAGFALGTIFIGVLVYLSNLYATARQFANNLFSSLAILSLFYCLVSGVRLTAGYSICTAHQPPPSDAQRDRAAASFRPTLAPVPGGLAMSWSF